MPDEGQQMNISLRYLWEQFQGWWQGLRTWARLALFIGAAGIMGAVIAGIAPPNILPPLTPYLNATLSFQPDSNTVSVVGDPLEVAVYVGNPPPSQSILAVEATITFDAAILSLDTVAGTSLIRDCVDSNDSSCILQGGSAFSANTAQTLNGSTINIVRGAPSPGVTGTSALLVTLRFRTLTIGTTVLQFVQSSSHVVTVNGGQAQDILFRTNASGFFVIGGRSCADYGGTVCPASGGAVCAAGTNQGASCTRSNPDCPLPGVCKTGTGVRTCENNINIECSDNTDCIEFASCQKASGAYLCINGTEHQDNDPSTVCCSAPCTQESPGQLYIRGVGVTTAVTAGGGNATIAWSTYPSTGVASQCDTNVGAYGPYRTTGDPTGHSRVFAGLALNVAHRYTIVCTAPGYAPVTVSGTFTIASTPAEILVIEDLIVSGITGQFARVSYGTKPAALGTVAWGEGACPGASFSQSITDVIASLPHAATIRYAASATVARTFCARITATVQTATGTLTAGPVYREFTVPLQSALAPDANVLVKVVRDRVCKQWLYCQSAVRLKNSAGKSEDVCFDLGVCDALDSHGACANPSSPVLGQGGTATFAAPTETYQIKNVSGYAKVGLDWGPDTQGNPRTIAGLYPYGLMTEVGRNVRIQNGSFESGQLSPWRAHPSSAGGAELTNYPSVHPANPSHVLRITPGLDIFSGARVPLGILYPSSEPLRLVFRARTDRSEGKIIRVQLANTFGTETFSDFSLTDGITKNIPLTPAWTTYQMTIPVAVAGEKALQFVQDRNTDPSTEAFYIDDASLQPVLEIGVSVAGGQITLPRACRLYPTQDAPACDFLQLSSGKEYRGWKGYCVERLDPALAAQDDSQNDCLIWWPVDVLAGSADLFNREEVAGYKGRKPLYYCLESKGDWPYYDHQVAATLDSGSIGGSKTWPIDIAGLDIHRDELIEVRLNGIKIDFDGNSEGDCELYAENTATNQAEAAGNTGIIRFNANNREHWSDAADSSTLVCDSDHAAAFNPYAWVRCANRGRQNDCNIMTGSLTFDAYGILQNVQAVYRDGSGGSGRGVVGSITITYRGERCNVIAQVVTPDGDAIPYTARLSPGGWSAGNLPGYPYTQDFAPYGSMVPPAGKGVDPGDPATWPRPAYVEAPLDSFGQQSPYQYRAGNPYGVRTSSVINSGTCSISGATCTVGDPQACVSMPGNTCVCFGGPTCNCFLTGDVCTTPNTLCGGTPGDTCNPLPGFGAQTEGGQVCITGSQDRLGKSCEDDPQCGFADTSGKVPGICAGMDKPGALWGPYLSALQGGSAKGKNILSQLFARSYGVWALDPATRRYRECRYPLVPGDAPNPRGCVEPWVTPTNIPVGTQPSVRQIIVNDAPPGNPAIIKRAGGVVLKFTASVNADHLPLVAYRVDWGDNTAVTEVSGLRIYPKSSMSDPHIVLHTYQCSGAGSAGWDVGTQECHFVPAVQVTDNWGLCNGGQGAACAPRYTANSPVWKAYDKVIRVKP